MGGSLHSGINMEKESGRDEAASRSWQERTVDITKKLLDMLRDFMYVCEV